MLALADVRAGRCRGCGHDLDETTSGEHRWRVREVRCWACHDLEARKLQRSKTDKPGDLPGARLTWVEKVS